MFKTPILFLIFNRPDTTQRVFNEIKKQQPKFLFVGADGPRPNKQGEKELCEQTRDILKQIDWDCEVKTLFRDKNLGCGLAISSAITWFFDQVEEGIILEDDCLPHPDFFGYCEELLECYRLNSNIGFIGGSSFHEKYEHIENSYFFSKYAHVWGWATWKRVWNLYDPKLEQMEVKELLKALKNTQSTLYERNYFTYYYYLLKNGLMDTWDYQMQFCLWQYKLLTIIPYNNLICNIGTFETASHPGRKKNDINTNRACSSILPLIHPDKIFRNTELDIVFFKNIKGQRAFWDRNGFVLALKYLKKRLFT